MKTFALPALLLAAFAVAAIAQQRAVGPEQPAALDANQAGTDSAEAAPEAASPEGPSEQTRENTRQQLIRVCTLDSVEANQEFQRNVQIVQALRRRAIELNALTENLPESGQRDGYAQELKEVETRLNEANKKMVENYGFSILRDYIVVPERAHVYMFVTEKEAQRYMEAQGSGAATTSDEEDGAAPRF